MQKVCADTFITIFSEFDNKLNAVFQGKTNVLKGGRVRIARLSGLCRYKKHLVSKEGVTIDSSILYDTEANAYLFYTYNIFFEKTKLMFHYEPTHKEHFQPHINVYLEKRELKNLRGEGIHIMSHQYHPFELLAFMERYFG
jgi:hypothetical protein